MIAGSLAFFSARGGLWALLQGGAVQYDYEHLVGSMAGSNAYALATAVLSFLMLAVTQNALNDPLHGIEDMSAGARSGSTESSSEWDWPFRSRCIRWCHCSLAALLSVWPAG